MEHTLLCNLARSRKADVASNWGIARNPPVTRIHLQRRQDLER
ncbi:unnamed protein product [Linum tenue]|uniref:Uncharacterized protein n=1 Tax=Linum tenue TaxID=586396 RepID=A0AAV0RQY6_9ROSI|nr:unnamed protein product [Linum tenue]